MCQARWLVLSILMNQVLPNTHLTGKEAGAQRGHRTSRWQSWDWHRGQAPVRRSSWAGEVNPGTPLPMVGHREVLAEFC